LAALEVSFNALKIAFLPDLEERAFLCMLNSSNRLNKNYLINPTFYKLEVRYWLSDALWCSCSFPIGIMPTLGKCILWTYLDDCNILESRTASVLCTFL